MPSFSSYRKCNYLKISGLRFFYPISTPSLYVSDNQVVTFSAWENRKKQGYSVQL